MSTCGVTLMPVLVASLTASSSLSYFGLKVTVKAQSIIRPERSVTLVKYYVDTCLGRLNWENCFTIYVRSKVNFADIVVAQYSGVSCIGGVVCSTVVNGAAGGEGQACFQPVLFDEFSRAVLQLLAAKSRNHHKGTVDENLHHWQKSRKWLKSQNKSKGVLELIIHKRDARTHQMSIIVIPGLIQLLT